MLQHSSTNSIRNEQELCSEQMIRNQKNQRGSGQIDPKMGSRRGDRPKNGLANRRHWRRAKKCKDQGLTRAASLQGPAHRT